MADAQRRVQAILDEATERGEERGLQVAAYREGELVVDAWSGVADPASRRPVDGDTLFTVFSATKAVAATVVHLLADRDALAYDAPVSAYWPAFGAHGKARVTVGQLLAHMSGIPQVPEGVTPEALCDWGRMCRAVADLVPLWEPGTRTGYSSYTWGWVVGEVVRRADGRPIARVVREEVGERLGIADALFLGVPAEAEHRVARLEDGGWAASLDALPADALARRGLPPHLSTPATFNRPDVRRACIPGLGGTMSARALARHFAALLGPVGGVRLLTPERLRLATALQTDAPDAVMGRPIRKGLGYFLGGSGGPMGRRATVFGMPGIGGTLGFADPEYAFAFALTKNRLTGPAAGPGVTARAVDAARAALGIPEG